MLPVILVAGPLVANILLLQPTKSLQWLLELKHLSCSIHLQKAKDGCHISVLWKCVIMSTLLWTAEHTATSYRRIVSLEETENTGYVPDENKLFSY